ncbi:proepiregulin-like [Pholidichthys leucotaenia]
MGCSSTATLLSLTGILLIWPYVLTKSVPSRLLDADGISVSAGQKEERHHVVKRSVQRCSSSYDNWCLNNGTCIVLVDSNVRHCKCEKGFEGPRCSIVELVHQPMGEEQIIVIIFCMGLLIIGLAGALYLFWKWCKRNSLPCQQKCHSYRPNCLE